jgi:hypothetical protein
LTLTRRAPCSRFEPDGKLVRTKTDGRTRLLFTGAPPERSERSERGSLS